MTDDDGLDDVTLGAGTMSTWTGTFEGGPFDGGAFQVEAPPFAGMRGMTINVCLGEELDSSRWHVYNFGQKMDANGAVQTRMVHLGALPTGDDPSLPLEGH